MEIQIRRAVKQDCPRLMELIQELAEYERASEEVTVTMAHFEESGFGTNPVWQAFVATTSEDDGNAEIIVGFALYYIRYSTWKGQRMYLEDILVTNEMRGKGIGKLLFDALIAETKVRGFSGMLWQVLDWNQPAIDFYKKLNAEFDNEWINCSIEV